MKPETIKKMLDIYFENGCDGVIRRLVYQYFMERLPRGNFDCKPWGKHCPWCRAMESFPEEIDFGGQ